MIPYALLYPVTYGLGRLLGKAHPAVGAADDYADGVVEESLNDLRENYNASPEYSEEGRMVQNVMELRKSKVRDCMVPASDIVRTSFETPLHELVALFTQTGFSKILIYRDSPDKIAGYVHAYDLFREPAPAAIAEILRPIHAVPETTAAGTLLKEMIEKHKSIAAVFDANGAVSGMLTLEDLMEEIFGEIEDEFDVEDAAVIKACLISQKETDKTTIEQIDEFRDIIKSTNISMVKEIDFYFFTEQQKGQFITEIKRFYGELCTYVHSTPIQIQERIELDKKGRYIGFEGTDELRELDDEVGFALSYILCLFFHAIPQWCVGDYLVERTGYTVDSYFSKYKYFAMIDEQFDYKCERQDKLIEIQEIRKSKICY